MGDDYDWEQELNSYRRTTTNRASADGGEAPKASTTPLVAAKTGASPVTPLTLSSPGSRPSGVPLGSPTPSSASSPPPAVSPLSTSGGSSAAPNRALPVPPSKQATTPTPASPPPAYSTAVAAKSPTAASASTPLEKSQSTSNTNNVTSPTTADTKKKTGILGGLFGSKNKDKDKDKDAKPADGNKESKKDDSDSDDDKDTKKGAGAADDDDDEDEKEGNDGWVEFKDEKGVKLWYNTKTRETSIGGPPAGKAGAGGRSSSNAVGDIDMDDEDEDLDEDGQPKARRGEAMVDELGDDQQGPVTGKKKNKQEVMTPEKIVTTLRFIEKQVEHILEHSHTLAPAVCEDLRAIVKSVESCQKQLETSETVDNRGDVDALIEWNKLPWNWDNIHVHGYRAGAARIPHHEYEYKEWHLPQSFSDWPLPPDSKSVTAVVRLPTSELEAKAAKDSATVMTHTRISISEGDTVNKCVASCYAKCKGLPGDATEYVLKASGLADYMDGPKLLFSYEYIRACLRDNIEVKLVMVRRPQPQPDESKDDLPAQYRAKVDPNMEVMSVDAHRGLSIRDKWDEIKAIPLSEQALPFRIRIIGMDKVNNNTLPLLDNSFTTIWLKVFLFHGQQYITESIKTTVPVTPSESPRWMTWLMGDYQKETLLNQLPRACRIGFILFGRKETEKEKDHMLGWASHQLIDQWGRLSSGAMDIRLWPIEGKKKKGHGKKRDLEPDFIFRQTNRDNQTSGDAALLRVKFDEFAVPVVAPLQDRGGAEAARAAAGGETPFKSLHKSQQKRIEEIIESDLLCELTNDDKLLIWTMRHHLSKFPTVLPKFLLCVNWGKPEVKNEALRLLTLWAPPVSLVQALELLDAKYPDYTVREYAVNLLRKMKNDELRLYLLQLVQCLKFEPYHDSPLARFLIERAIRAPYGIGHHFFWHLKAELHSPYFQERFAVILEEYLSHAGRFARELRKQNQAVLKLQRVAEMVVKLKREGGYSDEEALPEYRKEISKLNSDFFGPMGKFQIPLNPQLEATTLIVEKCRYMSSKMVPLWLVFRNADDDAPPIYIIFKSGDDLRQDILTLQILRVMDKMWLGAGLDMRMKPYRVIATGVNDHGEGVGMIEVVLNSDTTSGIQLEYGGGAMGALKMDPIDLFLHNHNKGAALYDKAVQNFIMSCAGYCVATFVLGIGDRHNGNIMVTKDGHLFHIDFGHFLGNFKKKFGVNRERAAFVFTPEMAFVMGGKKYQKSELFKKFLRLCSDSFKTLRGNAITLENLFVLMVSAGMPELMKEQDIFYMRDKLYLNVNEKKADKKLHAEINKSLDSTYRRIDNMIHNLKHG